jgi:hypothetical protein
MDDKSRWILIENEGALFRGPSVAWPREVWNGQTWQPYAGASDDPKPQGWGQRITEEEFKEMSAG